MSSKNPLNKFRSRPNVSFRYNPAEEDLLEELTCPDLEPEEPRTADPLTNETGQLADMKQNSLSEDENFATPSLSASSSQSEVTPSSRDASPIKEVVKDYLNKVGKRSASLDYNSDGERWSLSGIRGRIAKHFEELGKDGAPSSVGTLIRGASFSGEKKLKESTSANEVNEKGDSPAKTLSARSHSSLDVRTTANDNSESSISDRSASVEEGIDCTAAEQLLLNDLEGLSPKNTKSNPATNTKKEIRKRSNTSSPSHHPSKLITTLTTSSPKNTLKVESVSLSSLKATRSFESELLAADEMDDLSGWEILDSEQAVEEKPETPLVFESKDFNGRVDNSRPGLSQQAWHTLTALPTRQNDFQKGFICIAVAVLSVQLSPLSSYFRGLFTGVLLSYLLGHFLWKILQPAPPKQPIIFPDFEKLPPLRIPVPEKGELETNIYKGWMNKLPDTIAYDPDNYNVNFTHSIYVRLEGSQLRISYPKVNISRRAMWNEEKPNPTFVDQKHCKLLGCTVALPPEGLAKKRLWSKKYPICLSLAPDTMPLTSPTRKSAPPPTEDENQLNSTMDDEKFSTLYLFARSCREKEEWHRRFISASIGKVANTMDSLPSPEEGTYSDPDEDFPPEGLTPKKTLNYESYMAKYISQENVLQSSSYWFNESFESSPQSGPSDAWLNAFIGRLFFDFFTYQSWSSLVTERIQRKLSVIKVPYFMEELKIKDINLGVNLPSLRRSSPPLMDERGLWVDFDVTYKGTFQMTLETKLNLMRLKKEQSREMVEIPPTTTSALNPQQLMSTKSYLYNSDEEDSAESSSDEDLSSAAETANFEDGSFVPLPSSQSSSTARGSTSKKLLQWVDKFTQSRYFQQGTEIGFIKKAMASVSKTPIVLSVEVLGLNGTLALNVPPPPTDRLWYGFRGNPQLSVRARPKLGEHVVTLNHIVDWIEKKLTLEFQKLLVMPNMDDLVIPIMEPGLSISQPK